MRRWWVALVMFTGCKSSTIEMTMKEVPAVPGSNLVVVEVETEPHVLVDCRVTTKRLHDTAQVESDDQGKARLEMGKRAPVGGTLDLECMAQAGNRHGSVHATVERPVRIAVSGRAVQCFGEPCSGSLSWWKDSVSIDMKGLPEGAKIVTSKGTVVVKSAFDTSYASAPVSLDELGDLALADVLAPDTSKLRGAAVPFSVVLPEGNKIDATIPVDGHAYAGALEDRLRTLSKGPVRFANERATTGSASLLIVGMDLALVGEAVHVRDIDRVAIFDARSGATRDCGMYQSEDGSESRLVTVTATDIDATVYDRRTGRKLGSRSFTGKPGGCPDKAKTTRGSTETIGKHAGGPDYEVALAWVRTFGPGK